MPLDGLRAWIGELERKLGARTRVGLVLVALAVGAGGAGIYLALDAADNSVSKDDLKAAQEQAASGGASGSALESRAAAAESAAESATAKVAKLEAKVKLLETAMEALAKSGLGAAIGELEGGAAGNEEPEAGNAAK